MQSNPTLTEFTGRHSFTIFRNNENGWCICKYSDKRGEVTTVVGDNLPEVKYPVTFLGQWKNDPRYGLQFKVDTILNALPDASADIVDYLASLGVGIGKSRAKKMVQLVGTANFWNALENAPDQFTVISGITEKTISKLNQATTQMRLQTDLIRLFDGRLQMSSFQFNQIRRVFDGRLDTLIEQIRDNPYCLMEAGYKFEELDNFASQFPNFNPLSPFREEAALIQILLDAEVEHSHVGIPVDQAAASLAGLLNRYFLEISETQCYQIVANPPDTWKVVCSYGLVYRLQSYEQETIISDKLAAFQRQRKGTPSSEKICKYLHSFEAEHGFTLAPEQAQAVKDAFTNRVNVITGGPGTGKSTILSAILYCWEKIYQNRDWLLLAPTGRAARRISETTEENASTIHSAICLQVDTERSGIDISAYAQEVHQQLIVVDEASMVDQAMMASLMKAIRHESPTIILVGDADQLPSVGAGNVLADIINSGVVPVSRLTTIFRQAQENPIVANSAKIRDGITDLIWSKSFKHFCYLSDEQNVDAVCHFYQRCVKAYGMSNVILLSPFRNKGVITTTLLNKRLQEQLNPDQGQPSMRGGNVLFRQGDRVIQTKNTETVKNGDIGYIQSIGLSDETGLLCLTVKFESGETVEYGKDELIQLDLAYALTVHKSQGAEYKVVLMILPFYTSAFLRRNLFYTGITRATDYVAVFGSLDTVKFCIRNNKTDIRFTRLAERLQSS